MRIIYSWNYLEWGGAQIYFLQIMKEARNDHEVIAVIPKGSNSQLIKVLNELGVKHEIVDSHTDTKAASNVLRKLQRHFNKLNSEFKFYRVLAKKASPDAVFHVDFGVWQSFLFLWFLSRKAPVFVTVHNPVTGHQRWREFLWRVKFWLLTTRRKNFYLFASNENAKDFLVKYLSKEKFQSVEITYSGVDLDEISAVERSNYDDFYEIFQIPRDSFLVFCVGQFIDRKGRWEFLEAAEKLLNENSAENQKIFFVWLSNSELNDEDRKKIRKFRVNNSFKLISAKLIGSRQSYLGLLSLADLFVLPSHIEGLPIAILEAMALRKPVISTKVNAIPEAVKHMQTGLLIEAKDSEQLACAIKLLKNDEELRKRLGTNARRFVLEKFDSKKIAHIALNAYEEALLK
jgi:glycosyltransferase involved in cell wall biosynthesis